MKVFDRAKGVVPEQEIHDRILNDVTAALNEVRTGAEGFIVNDTPWYWINPKGKRMPSVVNAATFISEKFQLGLVALNWQKEYVAAGQRIDGFLNFRAQVQTYRLPVDQFLDFLRDYEKATSESSGPVASRIYYGYCQRSAVSIAAFPDSLRHYFLANDEGIDLRVGLEFETGNIASSFRALRKLDYLYVENAIDLGVFITAQSKKRCASRIWPASNRNGSFEELEKRNYKRELIVPLLEFGFEPDGFDRTAPYLGANGALYEMASLGRATNVAGVNLPLFDADGREVVRD